jgi:hypothetical protein
MNIFYLSHDQEQCARQHLDKHVVKMIVEYGQLLSTAHRMNDGVTRETKEQYLWLYRLFKKLGHEYTHRYGKVHSTNMKLNQILEKAPSNIGAGWRQPPPAMSHYPQCIVPGDSIASYKKYYIEAKSSFAKWTKRDVPEWFVAGSIA